MSLQQVGDLGTRDRWKVTAGQEACGLSITEGDDPAEVEGSGVGAKTGKRRKSKSKRDGVAEEQSAMKKTRHDSADAD